MTNELEQVKKIFEQATVRVKQDVTIEIRHSQYMPRQESGEKRVLTGKEAERVDSFEAIVRWDQEERRFSFPRRGDGSVLDQEDPIGYAENLIQQALISRE